MQFGLRACFWPVRRAPTGRSVRTRERRQPAGGEGFWALSMVTIVQAAAGPARATDLLAALLLQQNAHGAAADSKRACCGPLPRLPRRSSASWRKNARRVRLLEALVQFTGNQASPAPLSLEPQLFSETLGLFALLFGKQLWALRSRANEREGGARSDVREMCGETQANGARLAGCLIFEAASLCNWRLQSSTSGRWR